MPPAHKLFHVTLAYDLTHARELTQWPLHMAFMQLNSIPGVELIEHLFMILPKTQLF